MPYLFIVIAILLISPLIIKIASKQDKKTKNLLKQYLLTVLILQIFLGFLNWENFSAGRSGFELSLSYPNSLLGLFFIISTLQILLLTIAKFPTLTTAGLNFINTILIFAAMNRLSSILGYQAVSFASVGSVFLVLVGNVIALAFINKNKNLLKKYPFNT